MFRNIQKWFVLCGCMLALSSFSTCQEVASSDLIGCWSHSYEENLNTSKNEVYRACDYKEFPASRFRFTLELLEAGQCKWLALSPSDGHFMTEGTWKFEKTNNQLSLFNNEGALIKEYRVKGLKNKVLLLLPLE